MTYSGNREPVVAAQSNVAELAYRALSLRSLVQSIESLWVDGPQGAVDSDETQAGSIAGEVRLRAETDGTGRGYIEADFRDFSDNPGEVINGRYVQRFRPEAGQPGEIDYSFAGPGTLEFDNLEVSRDGVSSGFLGTIRITGVDSDVFLVDLVTSANGQSVYFENSTLRFSEVQIGGAPRPAVDIAGAVYEQDQGGVVFSSLGPIPDLGYNDLAGYLVAGAGGGIELTSGGTLAHVRPLSFAFVSTILDIDGDGVPETAKRHSWPALAGETAVEASVMQGPIANAGNRRSHPAADTPVKVHGLFSHDDDGDWLTFQWQLLARPPLSAVSVDDVASRPYIELSPDMPGDYVLGLRVSDGVSASETSLIIRHAPSEPDDAGEEPAGSLEVGQPVAASTPILIDGRSALNWPYDQVAAFWHRTGFGASGFDETGDAWSTWFTPAVDGLNGIRFSHNSTFAGAPDSEADLTLAVGSPVFETAIDLAGDANAYDVHSLDFDADGDQDLAMRAGRDGNERILVFLSTGEGLVPGADVPAGRGEIAHGDLDGDGLPDFLSAHDDGLLLFIQGADHSLLPPQSIAFPASGCALAGGPVDIALDDADADGRPDVIAVHPCADAIVRWLQQSDGSFAAPSLVGFPNHRVLAAAFGDLDSDGRSDALVALDAFTTAHQSGVSILVSQPDGALVEEYFVERTGIGGMGGTVGDVDNDGRKDAVIVNLDELLLLRQQADGSLVSSVAYSDPDGAGFAPAVSLVDPDDDGDRDLIFCDDGPTSHLLLQQPDGTFSHVRGPGCFHFALPQAEIAASLDVNGDGRPDLVTVTEDARGAADERALVKVHLQGIPAYPRESD